MPTLDESKNQQERVDCGVDLFAIKNDLSSVERDMYLLKTSDYIIYITEDNVLLFSKEFLY